MHASAVTGGGSDKGVGLGGELRWQEAVAAWWWAMSEPERARWHCREASLEASLVVGCRERCRAARRRCERDVEVT